MEAWFEGKQLRGKYRGIQKLEFFFCVAIQTEVRDLCREMKEVEDVGVSGMDDGYVDGPKEVVFPAVESFKRRLLERCALVLHGENTGL